MYCMHHARQRIEISSGLWATFETSRVLMSFKLLFKIKDGDRSSRHQHLIISRGGILAIHRLPQQSETLTESDTAAAQVRKASGRQGGLPHEGVVTWDRHLLQIDGLRAAALQGDDGRRGRRVGGGDGHRAEQHGGHRHGTGHGRRAAPTH